MHSTQTETADEMKALNAGWKTILLVWWAILVSLVVYFVVGHFMQDLLETDPNLVETMGIIKTAFYSVTLIILIGVHFLRPYLLARPMALVHPGQAALGKHPAVSKYALVILIVTAMLEIIGILGFVVFLMSKETETFYLFLVISAVAMVHFRPRKEELMALAKNMLIGKGL